MKYTDLKEGLEYIVDNTHALLVGPCDAQRSLDEFNDFINFPQHVIDMARGEAVLYFTRQYISMMNIEMEMDGNA